jgi:hypothetical protein
LDSIAGIENRGRRYDRIGTQEFGQLVQPDTLFLVWMIAVVRVDVRMPA